MRLNLTIETSNAAFEGEDCGDELARILRVTAKLVEGADADSLGSVDTGLRDINGNKVGRLHFTSLHFFRIVQGWF